MRAGPLSYDKIKVILNAHVVPVFACTQEYGGGDPAPKEERTARHRIWRAAAEKKLDSGTVNVYMPAPQDGAVVDIIHAARAGQTRQVLSMLSRLVEGLQKPASEPLISPSQSGLPKARQDDLVPHLTARGFNHGSRLEFPGENWRVLERDKWRAFRPHKGARAGQAWVIAAPVAEKLTCLYPRAENNNVRSRRPEELSPTAALLAEQEGTTQIRLDGRVRMKHAFYPDHKDATPLSDRVARMVETDRMTAKMTAKIYAIPAGPG